MFQYIALICLVPFLLTGCEDTNVMIATEAASDAVKAVTLSDKEIQSLADQAITYSDQKNSIAPPHNRYAMRLRNLLKENQKRSGMQFSYKVYLDNTVNAFAMANGAIRIYSGLMDLLDDDELLFVIGHEMGHVQQKHINKKTRMAYAASALRKGIASQNNVVGDIARSQLGGFIEKLTGAQFSQFEEKQADDYGLQFLKENNYTLQKAVSALMKLAGLGNNHSFLSSHPDPAKRAERLRLQIAGKATSIEEKKDTLLSSVKTFMENSFPQLYQTVVNLFPRLAQM